ncbi:MFS transporter [Terriglobus sp. 2YAB30_2]|uniref:MFS transporter n=1 Tax=Terriglobus sp. 2YAB30_2 TaxID=3233023 RepID=UPI003F95E4AB
MERDNHFYGWHIVTAAFVVAVFGWGLGFYGPPVYLEVVRQTRGWPVALISGAVTLHFVVGLLIIPGLPSLHRRFGLPAVTFIAALCMASGVLGWALARTLLQLYVAALLTGAGWSALGAVAITDIVAPWFVTKRPLALGVAFNGGSVGGVIFSPLWVILIHRIGFIPSALTVGTIMVIVLGALAVFVLGRTPLSLGQHPDGEPEETASGLINPVPATGPIAVRESLSRDRAFLTLCSGMTLALFAQTGVVAHLVSVLVPALGTQGAGWAAGLSGLAAVIGRLLVGWRAAGTSDWRVIASVSLAFQVAGCAVLALTGGSHIALMVSGVVLFGFGVGNAISVPPVIANLEFSPKDTARVVALIVAISQGAYAVAPALFGVLRQVGPTSIIFFAAAAIQVIAIVAYLAGRDRTKALVGEPLTENESLAIH